MKKTIKMISVSMASALILNLFAFYTAYADEDAGGTMLISPEAEVGSVYEGNDDTVSESPAVDEDYVFVPRVAEAVLEKDVKPVNCTVRPESGSMNIVMTDGISGHWLGNGNSIFLQLMIDDAYWYADKVPEAVEVTVEYLDKGSGWFTLRHESPGILWDDNTDKVVVGETGELKAYTFYIPVTLLQNGPNGADIIIGTYSTKYSRGYKGVFIHSIKVEKILRRDPVVPELDTGRAGNILSADDSSVVDLKLTNEGVCNLDTTVEYAITDYNGNVLTKGSEEVHIDKGEAKAIPIDTKADRFDCYNMDLKINAHAMLTGLDYQCEYEKNIKFSRAMTWEKGDERNKWFWFSTHAERYDLDSTVELLSRSGAYGARGEHGLEWSRVETGGKGKYNFPDIAKRIASKYQAEGLHYIPVLGYGNNLYSNGRPWVNTDPPESEEYVKAYGKYAEFVASVAPENVYAIEMWNEFNNMSTLMEMNGITDPSLRKQNEGTVYMPILKAAYEGVKKANPDMKLIGGDTAGDDPVFHKSVFDAGGKDYSDMISAHPYVYPYLSNGINRLISMVQGLRKLMDDSGLEDQELIITETGWHTAADHPTGCSDIEQAEFIVKAPVALKAYDLVELFTYYDLEEDGVSPDYNESNFGVTEYYLNDNPGAAKPAYLAACAMNKLMPNAVCSGRIESEAGINAAYKFDRTKGDNIMVFWAKDKENFFKTYYLGCDSVELYDLYGNHIGTMYGDNGRFTFNHSERPAYAIGDFTAFTEVEQESPITYSELKSATAGEDYTVEIFDAKKRELTLSIDTTYAKNNIGIKEITYPEKGHMSVRFSVGNDLGYEHQVWFTLKDENETVSAFPIDFQVVPPMDVTISSEQNDEIGSRWYTVISVKNLYKYSDLAGVARITSPKTYENAEIRFSDLEPGHTKNIYFNAPMMLKKHSNLVDVEIEFDNGLKWSDQFRVDYTFAPYANNKPVLDGIVSSGEWDDSMWVYADMESEYDIPDGTSHVWGGPDDLSFKAKFKFDEENFYILVVVKDNEFTPNPYSDPEQIWNGDNVQFGLEDRISKGIFSTDYTEMGIALHQGKPTVYRWSSLAGDDSGVVESALGEIKRNEEDKETVYEFAIPWTEVYGEGYVLDETYKMGFSMVVNDADGGARIGWIQYNLGIARNKNAQSFGKLNLVRK